MSGNDCASEQNQALRDLESHLLRLALRDKAGAPEPSWELDCLKSGKALMERRLDVNAPRPNRHRVRRLGNSLAGTIDVPDEEWMIFMDLIAKACGIRNRLENPIARVFMIGLAGVGLEARWRISLAPCYPEGENALMSVEGQPRWEGFEAWVERAALDESLPLSQAAGPGWRL